MVDIVRYRMRPPVIDVVRTPANRESSQEFIDWLLGIMPEGTTYWFGDFNSGIIFVVPNAGALFYRFNDNVIIYEDGTMGQMDDNLLKVFYQVDA